MAKDRIEIRDDGLYTIREVFKKSLERKVERGFYVLFIDTHDYPGLKRLGYVCKVDALLCQLHIMDSVVYPHAPSPISAPYEIIPFGQVLEAENGFYTPMRDVYTVKRKYRRLVHMFDERFSDVGFIVTKDGLCLYVEKQGDRWIVR